MTTTPRAVDWMCYRKCPVCGAKTGQPCRSLSGSIQDGRPSGGEHNLDEPHSKRQFRSAQGPTSNQLDRRLIAAEMARRVAPRGTGPRVPSAGG